MRRLSTSIYTAKKLYDLIYSAAGIKQGLSERMYPELREGARLERHGIDCISESEKTKRFGGSEDDKVSSVNLHVRPDTSAC